MKKLLAISLLLVAAFALSGCKDTEPTQDLETLEIPAQPIEDTRARNCATDTRTCSDGTILNRQGLQCEFQACPAGSELVN